MTVQPLTERQAGYTAQVVRADLPDLQERPGDRGAAGHLQEPRPTSSPPSKAKPGGLNYGSPGLGTIPHLSMAELSQISKVEFNHVPFKGPAESIQMTIGGQIDFAVAPLTAAANSGLVMPGLFAEKRNPSIPDVPTVKEQGFDVAPLSIGGLVGPAGLPADIKTQARGRLQGGDAERAVPAHRQDHVPAGRLLRRQRRLCAST